MRITIAEFEREIGRMKNSFGEKSYGEERAKLIWKSVKDLNLDTFRKIVNGFISSFKYPPLPVDFANQAWSERKKLPTGSFEKAPENETECYDCGNFGFLSIESNTIKGLVACSCSFGLDIASYRDLPIVNKFSRTEWKVSKLDLSWFKPNRQQFGEDGKAFDHLISKSDKVKDWTEAVHESEKMWKQLRENN